jgi:hypothetical protein
MTLRHYAFSLIVGIFIVSCLATLLILLPDPVEAAHPGYEWMDQPQYGNERVRNCCKEYNCWEVQAMLVKSGDPDSIVNIDNEEMLIPNYRIFQAPAEVQSAQYCSHMIPGCSFGAVKKECTRCLFMKPASW